MNKSKLIIRALSASFAAVILFSLFIPFCVSALRDSEAIFNPEYFMTTDEGFIAAGGKMTIEQERVSFLAEDTDIIISAKAKPYVSNTLTNALYIAYENLTESQEIVLEYSYYDKNNVLTVNFENVDILQGTGKKACTVYIGENIADFIVEYKLTVKYAVEGTFSLYSLSTVSIYEEKSNYIGNIISMVYSDNTERINIKGTINHDIMIANPGAIIELYSIPAGTDNGFVMLEDSEPYADIPLSIRFEFDTPLLETWDRYNRYAIVLHKANGEKLFVDSCKYLSFPEDTKNTNSEKITYNAFKGAETMFTASATEIGVGTAVVDIHLDKLQNSQNTGYFYSVEGQNFYFDRGYILSIDKQIKALYGTGCKIYIRFLVSNDNTIQAFSPIVDNSETQFRGVLVNSPTARKYIHVFTDYLTDRYSGSAYGKIDGIILGKAIDNSVGQNFVNDMSMKEYAKYYCEYFTTVALTAKESIPDIELIVPFSADIIDNMNSQIRDNKYNRELLLDSIIKILSTGGNSELFSFTPMIESEYSPFKLTTVKSMEQVGEEGEEGETTYTQVESYESDCGFITPHNIKIFEDLLSSVIKDSNMCRSEYIFLWEPNEEIAANYLEAFYAYSFYKLFMDSNSKCFITSFYSDEYKGTVDKISKLKYMFKYIDTEKNSEITAHVPTLLGFEGWSYLVSDLDLKQAALQKFYEDELTYEMPSDVMGSFSLWNFGESSGSLGWFASSYCESVTLNLTSEYPQNLMGSINTKGSLSGEYASVSYVYEFPETITYAKYLSIDAAVDDDSIDNSLFEIKAVINGRDVTVEAKRTITKSGRISLILDLSRFNALEQIDYFTISIKEISGKATAYRLHIFDISIHSDTYNNEDFANLIIEERNRIRAEINGEAQDDVQSNKLWVVLLLIGILSTGIVLVLIIHSSKRKI